MVTITVSELDDDVVQRLENRASSNNRSLEAEARHILEAAVQEEDMEAKRAAFFAMVEPLWRATEGREHTLAEDLIREDRDRGHRPHLDF